MDNDQSEGSGPSVTGMWPWENHFPPRVSVPPANMQGHFSAVRVRLEHPFGVTSGSAKWHFLLEKQFGKTREVIKMFASFHMLFSSLGTY